MRYLPLLLSAAGLCATAKAAAANSTAAIGSNCNIVANHTVIAGDSLANIGAAANVSVAQLQFVNKQITNPRAINVGDVIAIPSSKCVAPATTPLAEPTATCVNGTAKTTKVVSGDTLIIIAKEKLGITLPALVAANPQIKDINKINVGDVINIPLCATATSSGVGSGSGNGTTTGTAPRATGSKAPKKEKAKTARRARLMRRAGVDAQEACG